VSTDAIKGAALAGAALPIIAGAKGAGLSLAALSALSSSYLAVTQGYGGDAARAVGELAWKSTGAFKSVGTATKFFINGAVNIAKEKSREQMLEAVTIGDTDAAAKLDKDVQQILEEAEEAVAAAERAVETSPDNLDDEMAAKAEELAKLEDEDLLAKGECDKLQFRLIESYRGHIYSNIMPRLLSPLKQKNSSALEWRKLEQKPLLKPNKSVSKKINAVPKKTRRVLPRKIDWRKKQADYSPRRRPCFWPSKRQTAFKMLQRMQILPNKLAPRLRL